MVSKLEKDVMYQNNSVGKLQSEIYNKLSIFPKLKKEVAKEYNQEFNKIKNYLESLTKKKHPKKEESNFVRTFVPYLIKEIESTQSHLALNTLGNKFSNKETYELLTKKDGFSVKDLADPVARYQELSEFTILSQITSQGIREKYVHVSTVAEYDRVCKQAILELDRAASNTFGREIITPANFDISIKGPHQFLGQINVGFEQKLLKLYRIISHEGPWGHNTHALLSKESNYNGQYNHTSEGIAILGETLGAKVAMPDSKDALLLIHHSMNRNKDDSFNAAIEKLTFYDEKTPAQIIKLMENEIMPKEELKKEYYLQNNPKDVSAGAIIYYAGAHLVGKAYEKGVKATGTNNKKYSDLLKLIYTGNRPASVLAEEVNIFLENLKN